MGSYYRKNKSKFNSTNEKRKRATRNRARYAVEKKLGHALPAGMEVDHRKPLRKGGSNMMSNLRVLTRKANRSRPRK